MLKVIHAAGRRVGTLAISFLGVMVLSNTCMKYCPSTPSTTQTSFSSGDRAIPWLGVTWPNRRPFHPNPGTSTRSIILPLGMSRISNHSNSVIVEYSRVPVPLMVKVFVSPVVGPTVLMTFIVLVSSTERRPLKFGAKYIRVPSRLMTILCGRIVSGVGICPVILPLLTSRTHHRSLRPPEPAMMVLPSIVTWEFSQQSPLSKFPVLSESVCHNILSVRRSKAATPRLWLTYSLPVSACAEMPRKSPGPSHAG